MISSFNRLGRRAWWVAVGWAGVVGVTGFYADTARFSPANGVVIGVMSVVGLFCLGCSLRGWAHLLALPLYLFFAAELIVLAAAWSGTLP